MNKSTLIALVIISALGVVKSVYFPDGCYTDNGKRITNCVVEK